MSEQETPRTPPQKVRITKLQEAQLSELERIEAECAQLFYENGFSGDDMKPRPELEIAKLPRSHDVLVAEADHEPVAYLAWADHAPGIAWLPIIMVEPMHQRFGIGTHMLRELGEIARGHGIEAVVTPCWDRAPWGLSFLAVRGFQPMEQGGLIDKVSEWKSAAPDDLIVPGQQLWWAKTDGLGTIPGLPRPESVR
jgi:GNAT superfamily N-acetyltransferase